MKTILILVCRPGVRDPETQMIENTLEACQKLVGGKIQIAPTPKSLPKDILLVCNEEGLLEGLPMNRFGIPGTFFFCRKDGEEFGDLKLRQIIELKKYLQKTGW